MDYTLKLTADICFDFAMAILLWSLLLKNGRHIPGSRFVSAVFGVGLIVGAVCAGLRGAVLPVIPAAVGCMLSCTAFLFTFTFPGRKSEDGNI